MKLKKEKELLNGSSNFEEVLEFIKTARTLKRQVKLIRGISLETREEEVVKTILEDLRAQFTLFKV